MKLANSIKEASRMKSLGRSEKTIFAEEIGEEGQRQFWVTHKKTFIDFYTSLRDGYSFYEIIDEDSLLRGYWDIDIFRTEGEYDGEHEDSFILKIIMKINEALFQRGFTTCRDDFTILESSTSVKFSVHLILSDVFWFQSKDEIMRFTKECFFTEEGPVQDFSYVRKGKVEGIIDLNVYGNKQNFRLWKSCKKGKRNILKISHLDRRMLLLGDDKARLEATLIQGQTINVKKPVLDREMKDGSGEKTDEKYTVVNRIFISSEMKHIIFKEFGVNVTGEKRISTDTVLIYIDSNMKCDIVGRLHSRNNTYLLLNIVTMEIFKKCHHCQGMILRRFCIR